MNVRLTEIAHKTLVRFEIDLLVAEEDDAMRDYGVMHLLNLPIGQRRVRFTFPISAPMCGEQGVTVMVS